MNKVLSSLLWLSILIAQAQNTTIRDFVERLPLQDYTIHNATLRYYTNVERVDSADYTDLVCKKEMPGAQGSVVESSVRFWKSTGCPTPAELKKSLEKDCAQYDMFKVSNVRVLSDGTDIMGETPVVLQGEIVAQQQKFWRTCIAYTNADQVVFINVVYPQEVAADYYKRFTLKWNVRVEKISFLNAELKLPSRFVAYETDNSELIFTRCDLYGQPGPHVRAENFTEQSNPDDDLFMYFATGEEADSKPTYTTARKLYDDLCMAIKQDNNVENMQLLGQQTISTTYKPDEAFRITYTVKQGTEGIITAVEEVLLRFGKNVYRFRIVYPRKSATPDAQESTFNNRIREMLYNIKPIG